MDPAFFDELIEINEGAITSFQRWWRVLIVVGATFLLLSAIVWILAVTNAISSGFAPSVVTIFGIMSSTASLLPYKEIAPRQIAIAKYRLLKTESVKIKKLPKAQREEQFGKLLEQLKNLPT